MVVGALLLLLVLLVLLAPMIASSGPVRSFVLGKVNDNLNGRVQVDSWSLGWTGGLKLSGVRVFDEQNAQILQLKSLTTELSLLDAIRGRYHVGKVVVDGLDALVKTDAEGTTNFAKLPKQDPAAPQTESQPQDQPASTAPSQQDPAAPQAPEEPTKVPDVRGELHLVNCSATYEDGRSPANGGTGQTFHFPSIAGIVKFPDINKAIENAIEVTCRVGDGAPGKISVAGFADVIENNEVHVERASIDQTLQLQGLELGSLSFALGKDGGIQKLAGLTDGRVVAKVQPQGDATVDVNVQSRDFALGGPALQGETYQTKAMALVAPNVVVLRSAAPDDYTKWTIKAGTAAAAARADGRSGEGDGRGRRARRRAAERRRQPRAARRASSARTSTSTSVSSPRGRCRSSSPREGLVVNRGRLRQVTDVALAIDRAEVKTLTLDVTDVAGVDAAKGNAPVSLQPIHLAVNATSFGGGGAIPDLRDLKLVIKSAFADGTIEGRTIAETNGLLKADLRRRATNWRRSSTSARCSSPATWS